MKQLIRTLSYRLSLLVLTLLSAAYTFAQDGGATSVSVHKTSTTNNTWYTTPWVWIAGAAVFILLLVALLRGSNSTSNSRSV